MTGNSPMRDIERYGSGDIGGDTQKSGPVRERHHGRQAVQWSRERPVDMNHGPSLTSNLNKDLLQPSIEISNATAAEDSLNDREYRLQWVALYVDSPLSLVAMLIIALSFHFLRLSSTP